MGDLSDDTTITSVGPEHHRATVSSDWDLFGPVGGYLAALALRAAGVQTGLHRPVSLACHFLAVPRFEPVDLEVTSLRRTRRAESLRVGMAQDGKPVLEALVWAAAADLAGPERTWLARRDVPSPDDLPTFAVEDTGSGFTGLPFWKNLEIRSVVFDGDSLESGTDPVVRAWDRFTPRATFDDPWVDACRSVVIADVSQFPAIAKGFDPLTFMAPTVDLYVAFHAAAPDDPYLYVEATGSAAGAGVLGARVGIWGSAGGLLATGTSQLLCRPFSPT
jgi:acyl-CoA thioesterase